VTCDMASKNAFLDPLYGEQTLGESAEALARQPVIQRLRHVRLSNIDSVGMPGIANVSRYEHSVGTALLAAKVGFRTRLSSVEREILEAAALMHDSAIPPFGHLVEEAFAYVSAGVDHESRWSLIFANPGGHEVGGINLQIFLGRQAGIWSWAEKTFGNDAGTALAEILATSRGNGKFGKCICGDLDLDNLDNVVRAAFHMGIEVDRLLPVRIAEAMTDVDPRRGVVFRADAKSLIQTWLDVRKQVYGRFMLSRPDFVGKVMLIAATVEAYKRGLFTQRDWMLTDSAFLERLLAARHKEVSEPVANWLCGELWPLSELVWMDGQAPSYPPVYEFSQVLSKGLNRTCMAYAIKDKRFRALHFETSSGGAVDLGSATGRWLLGVCSSLRRCFGDVENKKIADYASKFFGTHCIGEADPWGTSELGTPSLFQ